VMRITKSAISETWSLFFLEGEVYELRGQRRFHELCVTAKSPARLPRRVMSDKAQAEHNESAAPPTDMKADIDFCR